MNEKNISFLGTVVRGIRAPIIKENDNIADITVNSVIEAAEAENIKLCDKDIVAVTEAVVARAQGNYATCDDIAKDIKTKFPGGNLGIVFPILSRNRFSICLRGIAMGVKKIVLQLSYPSDEVGNHLISLDMLDEANINPWSDVLDEKKFRELFGFSKHPFTGIDYIEYYSNLIRETGAECEIIFSNDVKTIADYTKDVLCCDIHTRCRSKRILKNLNVNVYGLDDILSSPIESDSGLSGYNPDYGLLGSNMATSDKVKLFPRECNNLVNDIQAKFYQRTGKLIEVMVYGDGAFKDPVGKIWELADPVVSPGYTSGLIGTPNELKLKYLADNNFSDLSGEELLSAIKNAISEKDKDLNGQMLSQGTTPRNLTDLIGSLCDLTSGSGDKGTPIILIQRYFTNLSN